MKEKLSPRLFSDDTEGGGGWKADPDINIKNKSQTALWQTCHM